MNRILLVEDDPSSQLLFRTRLEELGHAVVVAATGARGLMEARAGKFDLFLVDIGLGSGIDGYEVCRRLKAVPELRAVPAVLISGQVKSPDELHTGYEAGCESFLVKGDHTLIEDVVRAMLRIKALQDELGHQNRLLEEQNRRFLEEQRRGADLEVALRETESRGPVFRDLAAGSPDGVLVVDPEGVVRMSDRGAQDVLGAEVEGRHLASLAVGTGLEAFVRNARRDPHEAYRFDVAERGTGITRSLSASVLPMVPGIGSSAPPLKVVLLFDAGKRRVAAELLRLQEYGFPRREMGPLLEAAREVYRPGSLVGRSAAIAELRVGVARAAKQGGPVLLLGERGTGKGHVARILHFTGRSGGPFVPLDCAALAPELLENELIGYRKDAFPEAIADRPGLIQQAQDGTLYLESADRLPPSLQERLLEVLRTHRVHRAGGGEPEPVDVRLVFGTEVPADELAARGQFHPELLERISETRFTLPPLRERGEDVEDLAESLLARYSDGRELKLSADALWILARHDWPENVSELEECIETACASSTGSVVEPSHLSPSLAQLGKRRLEAGALPAMPIRAVGARRGPAVVVSGPADGDPISLKDFEKLALVNALERMNGDKLAAARLLSIGKSTFYRKLKSHGLS